MAREVSSSARSHSFRPYRSFGAIVLSALVSHGDGESESCQLCGHEQRLLDELVQPASTLIPTLVNLLQCVRLDFHRDSASALRPCLQN